MYIEDDRRVRAPDFVRVNEDPISKKSGTAHAHPPGARSRSNADAMVGAHGAGIRPEPVGRLSTAKVFWSQASAGPFRSRKDE